MKQRHRDLRGATVKLKCGRVVTIPMEVFRNRGTDDTLYVFHRYAVKDPQDIHRVLKFPNRKLPAGRDLRGCEVWLRKGVKLCIDSTWHRMVMHRYVHYHTGPDKIPYLSAFDDKKECPPYKHDIIRYRRKE